MSLASIITVMKKYPKATKLVALSFFIAIIGYISYVKASAYVTRRHSEQLQVIREREAALEKQSKELAAKQKELADKEANLAKQEAANKVLYNSALSQYAAARELADALAPQVATIIADKEHLYTGEIPPEFKHTADEIIAVYTVALGTVSNAYHAEVASNNALLNVNKALTETVEIKTTQLNIKTQQLALTTADNVLLKQQASVAEASAKATQKVLADTTKQLQTQTSRKEFYRTTSGVLLLLATLLAI